MRGDILRSKGGPRLKGFRTACKINGNENRGSLTLSDKEGFWTPDDGDLTAEAAIALLRGSAIVTPGRSEAIANLIEKLSAEIERIKLTNPRR